MNTKIYTTLENGKKIAYDIILTFKNKQTNKNYIVYTDNSYDQNNKLRIYAAIYNPTNNQYLGEPIESKEWSDVITILDKITTNT